MTKVPTAEEYYLKTIFPNSSQSRPDEVKLWFETNPHAKESVEMMIGFARLHVQEALKSAFEDAPCGSSTDTVTCEEMQDAIINSYPQENIK